MDKRFLKECIKSEIYDSYKIWCRYFCPESKLVFSIHKYLYYAKNKGIFITNAEIEKKLTLVQNCTIRSKTLTLGSNKRSQSSKFGDGVTMYVV